MSGKEEKQKVVFIFIKKNEQLLFQKNAKWGDYSFIGGKVEETDESPIEAAYRETSEELPIQRDIDFILKPIEPIVYETEKMSRRTGKLTHYIIYLFLLYAQKNIVDMISGNENLWVSYPNVEEGVNLSEISLAILEKVPLDQKDSFEGIVC